VIVAGFGFRAAASVDSLREVYGRAIGSRRVDHLATTTDKASSPAFTAFAAALNLPTVAIDAKVLTGIETHTQSEASQAARGTGSLAEAAALAAAGSNARLLTARVVSLDRMATCAIAFGDGE